MSTLSELGSAFSFWIDAVARAAAAPLERLRSTRRIEAVEGDDGEFAIRLQQGARGDKAETLPEFRARVMDGSLKGSVSPQWATALRQSRVVLVLQPSRFMFRPLELPKRASEFLDGIVRAQIDRLTPWSASDAAYHWTRPSDITGERIAMTIVATARSTIDAFVQAFAQMGAAGVEVATAVPGSDAGLITVYRQQAAGMTDVGRIRAALLTLFVATGLMAALSLAASGFFIDRYDEQSQQIQRQIAERRAAIRAGQAGTGNSPLELLQRRKHTTPLSVLVIEALSDVLPDHTYVTELRIEGDKLQIIGITGDAPSLIQLLEQSPYFARASFFAPTTRSPSDPGERFHIEAQIKPAVETGI